MAATAEDGERQRTGEEGVLFGFGSLFGERQWRCGSVDRPADPFIRGCGRVGLRFATFWGQRQSVRSLTDGL